MSNWHKRSVSSQEHNKSTEVIQKMPNFQQRTQKLSKGINKIIELCRMDEEKCNQNIKLIIQNEKEIHQLLSKNSLSQTQIEEIDKFSVVLQGCVPNNQYGQNQNKHFDVPINNKIASQINQLDIDQQSKYSLAMLIKELQEQYTRKMRRVQLINLQLLKKLSGSNKQISSLETQDINLFRKIIQLSKKGQQGRRIFNVGYVTESPAKQAKKFEQNLFTFQNDQRNSKSKQVKLFRINSQSIQKQLRHYQRKFQYIKNGLRFDMNPFLQQIFKLLEQGQVIRQDLLQLIRKKQEEEGTKSVQLKKRVQELQIQLVKEQEGKKRFLNDIIAFKEKYKLLQSENLLLKQILGQEFPSSQQRKPTSAIQKLRISDFDSESPQDYWEIIEHRKQNH